MKHATRAEIEATELTGMVCPCCGGDTTVHKTTPLIGELRRRRVCLDCGARFTTEEVLISGTVGATEKSDECLAKRAGLLLTPKSKLHWFLHQRLRMISQNFKWVRKDRLLFWRK